MRLARTGSSALAPGGERHALGKFYTPAIACELICRLAITHASCAILDPSCGNGEFLVAAIKRLEQLKVARSTNHQAPPTCNLHGIEIDGEAANQARVRLEETRTTADLIHIEVTHGDFFDAEPGKPPFPNTFDTVIGNPPYIRQELIVNKDKVRAHLSTSSVDERSDLYVYFFSRTEQWLADGGRVGFLTSERYLDTQYGRGLQQFLLEHFTIRAVIAFDKQLFPDALTGTVITILEKISSKKERTEHLARFLRVKRAMSIDEIESTIDAQENQSSFEVHDACDVVLVPQHVLEGAIKWRQYLFAPQVFFEMQQSPRLVDLCEIATIKRGITSGANDFFYRRENEFKSLASRYPGLKRYFRPLLKAVGQTDWMQVTPSDTDWFVLDVHHLVEECKAITGIDREPSSKNGDVVQRVKKQLEAMGHGVLVKYVEDAEADETGTSQARRSPRDNVTCTGRAVWFDLGNLLAGGIGFPKEYWTKFICPLVDPNMALDSRVYVVVPGDWPGIDPRVDKQRVLGALLNADLTAIFYECQGRVYAGQALDRASCMVYEACKLSVIDPRQLSTASLLAIQTRFDAILDSERTLVPKKTRSTLFETSINASAAEKERRMHYLRLRRELNETILDAIGIKNQAGRIEASVQELVDARRKRGGDDVQVMIGTGASTE